jgi:hypothetical protein
MHRLHAKALERQRHRQTETETKNLSGASGCEQSVDSSLYLRLVANHRPHHLPTLLFFSFSVRRLSFLAFTNPQECLQHMVATYCIYVFTQEKTTLLVLCTSAHLRHPHAIKSSSTKTLKHNSPVHQNLRQISLSLCNKTHICKMLDSSQTILKNRSPETGFLS